MNNLKYQSIMFIIMVFVGISFNAMNMLVFRFDDLYLSLTLFYGGLIMASNMMWAHEIIHFIYHGKMNKIIFSIGIILTILTTFIIRSQIFVDDNQWLRRMISHHSTALTTSHKIKNKTQNPKLKQLAEDIIDTQEKEISQMKQLLYS
tara:strand:- start:123 stop:566 length:444 start_codon:yes stop_codon:yes gene_type:complete